MTFDDAKVMFEPYGVNVIWNDTMKLYMLILNSVVMYMHPDDLKKASEEELKTFIATYVIQHISANPTVTLH